MIRAAATATAVLAGLLLLLLPAAASAHTSCPGGKRLVHHHKGKHGKVKHYCRQKRARHAKCRYGGHHHHRKRGRRVHYCAAKPPRKRGTSPAPSAPASPTPGPTPAGPSQSPPPLPGPGTPTPATPSPTQPVASRLQVRADEFSLTLSRPSLPPGPAIVELVNIGEDPHDLHIGSAGQVAETPAGGRSTVKVSLAAGSYTLFCALPGHAAQGMQATLQVIP